MVRWGALFCVLAMATGCSRLRPKPPVQWVYVSAKQTYLRDRVAAVSNRTGTVVNGDKLQVLDHGRRFLKVQTAKGEQGWIDEKMVANEEVYGQFTALKEPHKNDPVGGFGGGAGRGLSALATGTESERFFLLQEGAKLKMLERATLPKPVPPGMKPAKPAPVLRASSGSGSASGDGGLVAGEGRPGPYGMDLTAG